MPTLCVAPLYWSVAPRLGRGAATEPWCCPGVRPRGPEGRVGCRVKPAARAGRRNRREDMAAGRCREDWGGRTGEGAPAPVRRQGGREVANLHQLLEY